MLSQGMHKVTIVSTEIIDDGAKEVVRVLCRNEDGETVTVPIYITPATMEKGVLESSLRVIGFELSKGHHLEDLQDNQGMFAGNEIEIRVSMYNGRLKAEIPLQVSAPAPRRRLRDIETALGGTPPATEDPDDKLPF